MPYEAIDRIEKDVKIIKVAVLGDEEDEAKIGLKGGLALVKQSLGRAWWAIGIICIAILGTAFFVIRNGLS